MLLLFFFVLAQFAGEDPVVALEAALQFEDTRESMHAFCVGQYLEVRLCAVGITVDVRGDPLCIFVIGGFCPEVVIAGPFGGGGCH